jgi:hypothetical protein
MDVYTAVVTSDNQWGIVEQPYRKAPLIDEAFNDNLATVKAVSNYVTEKLKNVTTVENNTLVVHLSFSPGTGYTADSTYSEIVSAYTAGEMVFLVYDNVPSVLTYRSQAGGGVYVFKNLYEIELTGGGAAGAINFIINANNTWKTESAGIPHSTDTVTQSPIRIPTSKAVYDFVMEQLEAMPNAAEVGY